MRAAYEPFGGFATIQSYVCNGCRRSLGELRIHCLDCGIDMCEKCAASVQQGACLGRHVPSHACVDYRRPALVKGAEFFDERNRLRKSLETSSGYYQQLVFPLLDDLDEKTIQGALIETSTHSVSDPMAHLNALVKSLQFTLSRQRQGRFESYFVRRALTGSDVPKHMLAFSQGVGRCNHWKGVPMQKTIFECALYPMLLWELKPKTIIEVGSGTGASAVWMADQAKAFGVQAHIYSLDLHKSPLTHEWVTFIEGNCNEIERVLPHTMLVSLPHPWLVIEDAHENVLSVIRHLGSHLEVDDYLIVEDSEPGKEDAIGKLLFENPGRYAVDTWYTDFFGYNATCAVDSILKRVH